MDNMKLTEDDFNNLIDAVSVWSNENPDVNDEMSGLLASLLAEQSKEKFERALREKRCNFQQKKKEREREAMLLGAKLIMIRRAFMDSPSTFDLNEHIK